MGKPKYREIVDDIAGRIRAGGLKPGDRIDSIRTICEKYGVSAIVALRVFKELTGSSLIVKREGEGYFVALRGDERVRHNVVCVFRPLREQRTDDNFGNQVLCGAMYETMANHFHLIMPESCMLLRGRTPDDRDAKLIADEIFSFHELAGILLDRRFSDNQIRKYILPRAGKIPVVVIGRPSSLEVSTSQFPSGEIAGQVAELAYKSGCRIFAIFDGNCEIDQEEVRNTFRRRLKELGVPDERFHHFPDMYRFSREYDLEQYQAFRDLILQSSPERVFCFCVSDYVSRDLYNQLEMHGILGGRDYSLMGLGGLEMTRTHQPKLATVAFSNHELGSNAVRLLLKGEVTSMAAHYSIQFNETL
ncbi:MAG: GntR family transcriptional regulator [Lentisphaeria bacterium]|nr:GntR family transcriptional regulator [Lentisphaeria bacterium]